MKKVALITGSTSGMGKAIAEKFILEGIHVIIIGRDQSKLEEIQQQYQTSCHTYCVDISNETEVANLFSTISIDFSEIDIIVHAAGLNRPAGTSIEIPEAIKNWNLVIGTNLTGAFLISLHASPFLKKPGGRIIMITSIGAFTGGNYSGTLAYVASKAGMHGLLYSLAKELAPDGITVNAIAPGFIENTGATSTYSAERIEKMSENILLRRPGTMSDIAEACFFLSSEKASYITGEILNINGGWLFGR